MLLLLFSFYAYVGAAHLRGTASLDAAFVAALLGVVLLGPLAGALVFAAPELTRLANDRRLTSMLGNLASFGWSTLAAAWTLEALGYGSPAQLGSLSSYVAVAIAGLALILVNYFYITVISEAVGNGTSLWFLTKREFIPVVPVNVVLITMSAVTAFLYTEVGLAGLLPLAVIVFIPRLLVPQLLRDIPIWDLSVDEATARYAGGLANVLGLSSGQRRVLRDAATHLGGPALPDPPGRLRGGHADGALLARALGRRRPAGPAVRRRDPDREPRAGGRARLGDADRAGRAAHHAERSPREPTRARRAGARPGGRRRGREDRRRRDHRAGVR